jgi:hypothetical protein
VDYRLERGACAWLAAVLVYLPGCPPFLDVDVVSPNCFPFPGHFPFPFALPFISSSPSFFSSFSSFPTVLPTHSIMTRLMSGICHFGLADCIPNPAMMDDLLLNSPSPSSIISSRPSPGLTSLPDDVLLLVISLIGVEDILALRMVCVPTILTRPNRSQISDSSEHTDIKALHIRHQAALGMVGCAQISCHRQEITRASILCRSQIVICQGTRSAGNPCLEVPQKLVLPSSSGEA